MGNEDWIFRNQKMAIERNTRYNKGEKMRTKTLIFMLKNNHQKWLESLTEKQYEKEGEEDFIEWLETEIKKVL
jgi:hypothetical protein